MKGILFQKPLELSLVTEGETYRQGDAIRGTLTIKNHGAAEVSLAGFQVALAFASLSKVKAKAPRAFDILESSPVEPDTKLGAGQSFALAWEFKTDLNFPITENSRSPFLVYGEASSSEKLGHLQLKMLPSALIQELLDLLTVQFRFVFKSQKSAKGGALESKFAPPSGKAYVSVEELILSSRFDEDGTLSLAYLFHMKGIDASAGVAVKSVQKEFEQSLAPREFRLSNGRLNSEILEARIREVVSQVGAGWITASG